MAMTMKAVEKTERRAWYPLSLGLAILSLGIIVGGDFYYEHYKRQFRIGIDQQLSAIAELKADELVQYRRERLGDANDFFKNDSFSRLVKRFLDHSEDPDLQQQLQEWAGKYLASGQYDLICLFDAQGAIRLSIPAERPPVASVVTRRIPEVLKSGQIVLQDFYRNEQDGRIYLTSLVPIYEATDHSRPLGVFVMRIDPASYLYPFISRWPGISRTAETLLVRREGNEAVFLNELKFKTNTALALRIPLNLINRPAVQAALGQQGIVEGLDYRGVPVIADVRSVPDSPWFLVARMDTVEAYAPLRERLRLTFLFMGVLFLAVGAGVGLIWRQERLQFYKKRSKVAGALRESEERFRRVFEEGPIGMAMLDETFHFIRVNPTFSAMLGYSDEEMRTMVFADVTHSDHVQKDLEQVQRLMRGEISVYRAEKRYVAKSGKELWGLMQVSVMRGADGAFRHLLAIINDITERRQATEALLASEVRYRRLFETAKDGILILDARTGMVVDVNPFLIKILGFSHDAFLGKAIWELGFFKDIVANQTKFEELQRQEYLRYEDLPLETSDGRRINVEFISNVYQVNHHKVIQCNIRDITERKRAEETIARERQLLRTLIDILPEIFYIKDLDSRFLAVNETLARQFGKQSPAEVIGRSDADFFPAGLAAEFRAEELKVFAGATIIDRERVCIYPDGREHTVLTTKLPFRDSQGRICGLVGIGHDVTERKQAAEALRRSHEEFKDLFDNAPVGFHEVNTEGRLVRINNTELKMLGYTAEELLGQFVWIISAEEQVSRRAALAKLNGEPPPPQAFGRKFRRKDGSVFSVLVNDRIVRGEDGAIVSIRAVIQDDTDRQRAEEALRQNEERLLRVITQTRCILHFGHVEGPAGWRETALNPESPFVWDFPVQNVEVAQEILPLKLLGGESYESAWVRSRNLTDHHQMNQTSGNALLQDLPFYRNEFRCTDKFGIEHWMQEFVTIRKLAENRWQLFAITTDISDLKKVEAELRWSETQLQVTLESTADGILAVDKQGRVIKANRRFAELWRIPRGLMESGNDRALLNFVVKQLADPDSFLEKVEMLYNTDVVDMDLLAFKDGRIYERYSFPMIMETSVIGRVWSFRDITERKRQERELHEKNSELERFTYTVSHDLKSPLVTVKTFLGYLEQDLARPDPERVRQDVAYMRTAADKMSQMLDELLSLARVGRKSNPPVRAAFRELAQEAVGLVAGRISTGGVAVQVADAAVILEGDRPRLLEIWQNLLENACKFMGNQAKPRIEIGVEKRGPEMVFFVRDNGAGIEPRYHAKVFELFEKLDPKSEGTGMGLALVRRIVELYEGRIWVESDGPGTGANFLFTLPGAVITEMESYL
jgi:PAS domain S-box-containing protein